MAGVDSPVTQDIGGAQVCSTDSRWAILSISWGDYGEYASATEMFGLGKR